MADVTQPEIATAYQNVRENKSDINWLVLKYESARSDKLKLEATGTGGLAELRESGQLGDSEVVYAYVRVSYANDKESKREKFILISWIGASAGVMRKAKVSVHLADVKKTLAVYSIEVSAREMEDLKEEPIVIRLRKAGGASYDGV
ncbi:cofilin/tropomyosin-type actin-binding protein [Rhizoctonia solani]|uniref:Cofilin/tropomyosin-type actin-binding protein n=1 Tax=Rhizoctonia solani TaxID=456999 RepID=A0A8H8SWB4_9AGAM|nr:cofilin/tropomyosin-type actin-binding protein [Rhizoctonia solani]QRW19347.1 cofilin/tropomyosin-type actin-binding protein [Rhizoctonia solani]